MRVENNLSYACYDPQGAVTKNVSAEFHLLGPSYTFSADANNFTVIGCDDYALFSGLDANANSIGGCIALCSEEKDLNTSSCSGSDFDKCGYAFLGEKDTLNFSGAADLKVEASVFQAKIKKEVQVVIEWTVGTENCSQVQLNSSGYASQQNTKCVDFDGGTGYRCQCLPDIDECADPNNNPCVTAATCNNTVGGYSCICPVGELGDGKTNSFGCTSFGSRSQSATKFGLALIQTHTSRGHDWWAWPMEASTQPVLGGQAKYLG
ncbi:hypothetical protein Ancab_000315, partial [Ancistrocladus abbreviatus]